MKKSPVIARFTPFPALLWLMARHGIDRPFIGSAFSRLLVSLLAEPLRLYELARYGRKVRRTELAEPPVFILGAGRSGTTHLHNILGQDTGFGVVTNYQAAMHSFALTGRGLRRFMKNLLPKTRPMDNVAITLEAPQEEEVALVNGTAHGALHFLTFPRSVDEIYDRYVFFRNTDNNRTARWKEAYLDVLRKATILSGGKRLVLKTPPNTVRIPVLKEMFPGAKFIHICRDPYAVYASLNHMFETILPAQSLQRIDWDSFRRWIIDNYRELIGAYLRDRELVSPGNLAEVSFENLEERPMEVIKTIYETLGLYGFGRAEPAMGEYLAGLRNFQKNRFDYPRETIRVVNENWGFAFDAFGYRRLPA